jgi:hypothetical protein
MWSRSLASATDHIQKEPLQMGRLEGLFWDGAQGQPTSSTGRVQVDLTKAGLPGRLIA